VSTVACDCTRRHEAPLAVSFSFCSRSVQATSSSSPSQSCVRALEYVCGPSWTTTLYRTAIQRGCVCVCDRVVLCVM
uniref:Uncharacterized protein n=1 Tax=Anopheles arabiensis TaxID=7173 RepID=A0A182IFB8_ANOAR